MLKAEEESPVNMRKYCVCSSKCMKRYTTHFLKQLFGQKRLLNVNDVLLS